MSLTKDLFGNVVLEKYPVKSGRLRELFLEPPFTTLDARSPSWQERKKKWNRLGVNSAEGRKKGMTYGSSKIQSAVKIDGTSVFDPVLCELLYSWFCPAGGKILDPFAGGSVRGVVAAYLGFDYTGVDISKAQIEANRRQAKGIELSRNPTWIIGDSLEVLSNDFIPNDYDFVFSCPPYAYLEKYSDDPRDISNMSYDDFLAAYRKIIASSCDKLKKGGHACFVVGEVRSKTGAYLGFVPDTIQAFIDAGLEYYNEAILLTPFGSAPSRAAQCMKSKKLVKVHQNILTFRK